MNIFKTHQSDYLQKLQLPKVSLILVDTSVITLKSLVKPREEINGLESFFFAHVHAQLLLQQYSACILRFDKLYAYHLHS